MELKPKFIVTPVGSGGIYVGLLDGVQKYLPSTKLIGLGTKECFSSLADKLCTPWTPYAKALEVSQTHENIIIRLSEDEIKDTFTKFKHYACMEPSSAVVFAALNLVPSIEPDDCVVLINTGKLKQ